MSTHNQGCGIIKFFYLSMDKQMVIIHLSNQDLLARKLSVFFFLKENVFCKLSLEVPLMSTQNKSFLREIRKLYTS